jgi:hypothetical protein
LAVLDEDEEALRLSLPERDNASRAILAKPAVVRGVRVSDPPHDGQGPPFAHRKIPNLDNCLPRLNALTVMPSGVASQEEFERRQRLRVSIDIFNDRGELIESAHQDDVNIRELPLLEQSRSS